MDILIELLIQCFYVMFIFVPLGYCAIRYHAYKYQVTQEQLNQFLITLRFPLNLYGKLRDPGMNVADPSLKYATVARITWAILLLVFIVLYLVVRFIYLKNLLVEITLWVIFGATFISAWRFGNKLGRKSNRPCQ